MIYDHDCYDNDCKYYPCLCLVLVICAWHLSLWLRRGPTWPRLVEVTDRSLLPVVGRGTRCQLRCTWWTLIMHALGVCWGYICLMEAAARSEKCSYLLTYLLTYLLSFSTQSLRLLINVHFLPQQFLMLITYQSSADEYRKPAGTQPPQPRRTINFSRRFSWRPRDERRRVSSCEDPPADVHKATRRT